MDKIKVLWSLLGIHILFTVFLQYTVSTEELRKMRLVGHNSLQHLNGLGLHEGIL